MESLPQLIERHIGPGHLAAHFQPIVDLVDKEVIGLEALMRWQPVGPTQALNPTFLIDSITSEQGTQLYFWMLRETVEKVSASREFRGFVSLNIEADQMADPEAPTYTSAVLDQYGMAANRLVLEVTERRPLPISSVVSRAIPAYHKIGVKLAMDDYGQRFASFDAYRVIKPGILKIPHSVTKDLTSDPHSAAFIKSMLMFCDELGINLIVEGVNTLQGAALLKKMGVRLAQGFLFGEPRPLSRSLFDSSQLSQVLP